MPLLKKIEEEHASRLYSIAWIVEERILETLVKETKPGVVQDIG